MLPEKFEERMKVLLKDDFEKYKAALSMPQVRAFRVNTNKISPDDFEKINPFGGEKISFADNSYYFDYDKIGNHPFHHAGMIYIQEPAAMAAVAGVKIEPDWKVLDLCASPGGKSTQAADKLKNGLLVSNEIVPSRCKILTGNIERMGYKNVITTCTDAKRTASLFGEEFDLVIVDAPCSGEGMFRKEEIAVSEWSEENVELCAKRQREILGHINSTVKRGGYLLYSTCTFSLDENEKMIDEFLSLHSEFKLVKVKQEVIDITADGIRFEGCRTDNIEYCRRFYPHISKGEGQFIALMKKDDGFSYEKQRKSALSDIPKNEQKTVFDFLDDTLISYNKSAVKKYKDNIVYFDSDFVVPETIAFSCGVTIGALKKNYVQPHHQFFMSFGNQFKRQIELDAAGAESYLKGLTIPCSCENGWAAVMIAGCTLGCTLGGAKAVNQTAKNHYPKGLRKV